MVWLRTREFQIFAKKASPSLSQTALKFHSISIFLMVLNSIVFVRFCTKNCFKTLPNDFKRETLIIVLPSIKGTIFHSTKTEIGLAWVKNFVERNIFKKFDSQRKMDIRNWNKETIVLIWKTRKLYLYYTFHVKFINLLLV